MHVEPVHVMVWFGRTIEAEPVSFPKPVRPAVKDVPLELDELAGTLSASQHPPDGWYKMVQYRHPTNGIGLQNYIGWFPAGRLRLTE